MNITKEKQNYWGRESVCGLVYGAVFWLGF